MLNEGLRITVNAAAGDARLKFFHRSRGLSRTGRWVGVALGLTAVVAGREAWRDWTKSPSRSGPPVEARGERHGPAHVADGDSVAIGGTRLRLVGIDAPELAQTCRRDGRAFACGETAKARLLTLIDGRPLDCRWDRRDKYGRGLAVCRVGAVDLGAAMVRDGWAVAYGLYEAEEAEAQRAKRGLWAGSFEWPEDFRRHARRGAVGFLDDGEDER